MTRRKGTSFRPILEFMSRSTSSPIGRVPQVPIPTPYLFERVPQGRSLSLTVLALPLGAPYIYPSTHLSIALPPGESSTSLLT
jgi:hypothetical protein